MVQEPDAPRTLRGWELAQALKEDLDLYSVEDLNERVGQLEAEIARVRAILDRKRNGRAAADALFSLGRG